MDLWQVVGVMGIVFTSSQLIPQIVKSLRTRQVRDLSLGLSVVVGLSALCWLAYGIHLRDFAIITANGINLAGAMILFFLKISTKGNAA